MPGSTSRGYPFQVLADRPHGPDLGEDLAKAVDLDVAAIDLRVTTLEARGVVFGAVQTASGVASVTFSGIPSTLQDVRINWTGRGTSVADEVELQWRVNADSSAIYRDASQFNNDGVANVFSAFAKTGARLGYMPGANCTAGVFGGGECVFHGWNAPHAAFLAASGFGGYVDTAGRLLVNYFASCYTGAAPYTSITLIPFAGNFLAGTQFTLIGWEF